MVLRIEMEMEFEKVMESKERVGAVDVFSTCHFPHPMKV